MIALADRFSSQYRNERVFVESLLGAAKLEARAQNWTGARLFDADWSEDGQALIVIERGEGDVTVDDVRDFVRRRKQAEQEKK